MEVIASRYTLFLLLMYLYNQKKEVIGFIKKLWLKHQPSLKFSVQYLTLFISVSYCSIIGKYVIMEGDRIGKVSFCLILAISVIPIAFQYYKAGGIIQAIKGNNNK